MQKVTGKVELKPINCVKPNPWNPNRMSEFAKESLKNGLQNDGWLASQALLIWGSDETGKAKNLIIDGEHRWTAASELDFKEAPMVFLHKLSEAKAKALTIKMNAKRGEFQEDLLAELLQSIQFSLEVDDLPLDIGINPEEMMKLLDFTPVEIDTENKPESSKSSNNDSEEEPTNTEEPKEENHIAMVQLYLTRDEKEEFDKIIKAAMPKLNTKNVTETAMAILQSYHSTFLGEE